MLEPPRRAWPPGNRWWCHPAVDLSPLICRTCFTAAQPHSQLCGVCANRLFAQADPHRLPAIAAANGVELPEDYWAAWLDAIADDTSWDATRVRVEIEPKPVTIDEFYALLSAHVGDLLAASSSPLLQLVDFVDLCGATGWSHTAVAAYLDHDPRLTGIYGGWIPVGGSSCS